MVSSPIGCNLFLSGILKHHPQRGATLPIFPFKCWMAELRHHNLNELRMGNKSSMPTVVNSSLPSLQRNVHTFQFRKAKKFFIFSSFQVWESFLKNTSENFLIYPSPWSRKHGKSKKYTHALYWAQDVGPSFCCSFFLFTWEALLVKSSFSMHPLLYSSLTSRVFTYFASLKWWLGCHWRSSYHCT